MKLNALHPTGIVVQNKGEVINAEDYPLFSLKVRSQDGNIFISMNISENDTKKWVDIGSTGGQHIDTLDQEIAARMAADESIRQDMAAAINGEANAREAADGDLSERINSLDSVNELTEEQMSSILNIIHSEDPEE